MATPRTFKITRPHMEGGDVRGWRRFIAHQFGDWGIDYPLAAGDTYDVATRSATASLLAAFGLSPRLMEGGVTPALRSKLRNRSFTLAERVSFRGPGAVRYRRRLRKRFAGGGGVSMPLVKILADSNGFTRGHDGVDLICPRDAHGYAVCHAEVVRVSDDWWGLGNPGGALGDKGDGIVIIRALDDVGPIRKGDYFGYGHAERPRVREGARVRAGDWICDAGFANAPHFHFMWFRGNPGRAGDGGPKGIGNRDPMEVIRYARRHG